MMETQDIMQPARKELIHHRSQLDVRSCGLDALPLEIFELTSLEVLLFSDNNIHTIESNLSNLGNLKELWMACNQLNEIPPIIGNLTKLVHLNAYFNLLKEIPSEIGKLVNLQVLHLSANKISRLPSSISNLQNLISLELAGNEFKEFPTVIVKLTILSDLNFQSNFIVSLPADIGKMTSLRKLQLQCNNISLLPEAVVELVNLEDLFLQHNEIQMLPNSLNRLSKQFNNLWNLMRFDVSYNQLTNLPFGLGYLPELAVLKVEGNPLKGFTEDATAGLDVIRNYLKKQKEPMSVLPRRLGKQLDTRYRSKTELVTKKSSTDLTPESEIPTPPPRTQPMDINGPPRRSQSVSDQVFVRAQIPRSIDRKLMSSHRANSLADSAPIEIPSRAPSGEPKSLTSSKSSDDLSSASSDDPPTSYELQTSFGNREEIHISASTPDLNSFFSNRLPSQCPCCTGASKTASSPMIQVGSPIFNSNNDCIHCGHAAESHFKDHLARQKVEWQQEKIKELENQLATRAEMEKEGVCRTNM